MSISEIDVGNETDPATKPPSGGIPGVEISHSTAVINRLGKWWMVIVLLAIIVIFGSIKHGMFTKAAWLATATYAVEYLILSIGETFVMIAGEIDISVGAILGFSGLAGALIMSGLTDHHVGAGLASIIGVLAALAIGSAIGLFNGIIRVRFNAPSFIVTLGVMLAVGYGAVDLIDNGNSVSPLPQPINVLGTKALADGWLPIPVIIALALAGISGIVLQRTRFGLHTFMLGSSGLATRRAGVHVDRHIVICFIFAGLMAGVAGILVAANLGTASPLAGQNDGLYAITAVVIGGASLYGGRGTMLGTVVGVAILAVLTTGLVIINVSTFWQQVAIGAVLVTAICIDQIRTKAADA